MHQYTFYKVKGPEGFLKLSPRGWGTFCDSAFFALESQAQEAMDYSLDDRDDEETRVMEFMAAEFVRHV
jgi:hypothetical protein